MCRPCLPRNVFIQNQGPHTAIEAISTTRSALRCPPGCVSLIDMRPQPLIAVTDVEASSRWYQRLLGCKSDHGGPHYERLVHNGHLILQLHSFEIEHDHGRIGNPHDRPYGNGVLLWFEIDDFDGAMARVARSEERRVGKECRSRW